MNTIRFLNKLHQLRADPTFANLIRLAQTDPESAIDEINDYLMSAESDFNEREGRIWLVGYLFGACATYVEKPKGSVLQELTYRMDRQSDGGRWRYRGPYQPKFIRYRPRK